jgi:tripartite-type tricarboxylate transporter receptor subunit TctC
MKRSGFLAAAISTLLLSTPVMAQTSSTADRTFPNKPVKIISPYPAGGGADFILRTLTVPLSELWGQPIVIDYKPGAGAAIALSYVAKQPADGYTLVIGNTVMVQAPAITPKLPYDTFRDFAPITRLVSTDDFLVASSTLPIRTTQEFVELARKSSKDFGIGSYGNGTGSHFHVELLRSQGGIEAPHIAFSGGVPLITAIMGGQLAAGFMDVSGTRTHIGSDKVRVLAVTGLARSRLAPNVPTMTELGFQMFEPSGFAGLFAPAQTPKAIVNKIAQDVRTILARPEINQKYIDAGLTPRSDTPEAFEALMRADEQVWRKIATQSNIRVE